MENIRLGPNAKQNIIFVGVKMGYFRRAMNNFPLTVMMTTEMAVMVLKILGSRYGSNRNVIGLNLKDLIVKISTQLSRRHDYTLKLQTDRMTLWITDIFLK